MSNVLLLFAILLFTCPTFANDQDLIPEYVLSEINEKGAAEVANEIWSSESKTKQLLSGISSGNSKWLKVAYAISPGTDAGSAEDLQDAFSLAFLKAPYDQLTIDYAKEIKEKKTIDEACHMSWDGEVPGGMETYIKKAQHALSQRQPSEHLEMLRKACLKGLNRTLFDFKAASKPNNAVKRDAP